MFELQHEKFLLCPDLGQQTHDVLGSLKESGTRDQMQAVENQFFPRLLILVRCVTTGLLLELGEAIFGISVKILENINTLILGNNLSDLLTQEIGQNLGIAAIVRFERILFAHLLDTCPSD